MTEVRIDRGEKNVTSTCFCKAGGLFGISSLKWIDGASLKIGLMLILSLNPKDRRFRELQLNGKKNILHNNPSLTAAVTATASWINVIVLVN